MKNSVETLIGSVPKALDLLRTARTGSLIEYTSLTRVEPLTLIESRAMYLPYMHEIMQSLNSLFSGYYLQAVAISTNVGAINTRRTLDKLNPNRKIGNSVIDSPIFDMLGNESQVQLESYAHKLPRNGVSPFAGFDLSKVSMEMRAEILSGEYDVAIEKSRKGKYNPSKHDDGDSNPLDGAPEPHYRKPKAGKKGKSKPKDDGKRKEKGKGKDTDDQSTGSDKLAPPGSAKSREKRAAEAEWFEKYTGLGAQGASFGRDTIKLSQEAGNLSVGKLLEVTLHEGGGKETGVTIPVQIRLMVNSIHQDSIAHILTVDTGQNTFKERYHQYRAGQIEFMRDLVFCQDLIKRHRKTLVNDTSGIYADTLQRRNSNGLSAILSGNPSVATASTMAVITAETAKSIERELGGRLSSFKVRERLFDATYMMILVVVDPEWEQVTFYSRSIDQPTELSVKELKSANKSSGPDVSEILKAYQLGNSPSL